MQFTTTTFALSAAVALASTSSTFGVDAQFRQLDWEFGGDAMIQDSRVGEVAFHFDLTTPEDELLLDGAYVNVVFEAFDGQPHWVVRNLFLAYPDPEFMINSSPSVQFPLPVQQGFPLEQANAGVLITPEPMLDFPLVPVQPVFVDSVIHRSGGFNGGGSEGYQLPFLIQDWGINFDALAFPVDFAWTHTPADSLPKVNEERNGCAPGSAARSIEYLGDLFGFPTDGAQQIYDDLKDSMGTTVGEGSTGTTVGNFLTGKQAYTQGEGMPIDTVQKFGLADICEVMELINQGADVEIMISWGNGKGHAAMITSIIKWSDGSYTITYVDDPTQGDGVAENEEHTIHVNPNGTIQGGGSIIGFQIETVRTADLNGDGVVDTADLLDLLSTWGACDGPNCPADLNGDGMVDTADLLEMLSKWQ